MFEKLQKTYADSGMKLTYIEEKEALRAAIEAEIPEGATVSFGGSMTIYECGAIEIIREMDKAGRIRLLDRDRPGLSPENIRMIYQNSFFADVYVTSTNAMTEDGWLYNVDGTGNRVAALIYGPKKVLVFAGENKLVADKAAAVERMRTVAAPKNAMRLKRNTPCVKTGVCADCKSPDRICRSYVFTGPQREKDRISVLLLKGSYGY